jgi:hypothetical protein
MYPRFRIALVVLAALVNLRPLHAQGKSPAGQKEFYASYGFLSGSFNDYAEFSGSPMNGWDAAFKFYSAGSVGIKISALGLYGTNAGAMQIEHSVLVGPQWSRKAGRASIFLHGQVGIGFINSGAIPFDLGSAKPNTTFAALAGVGLDTPISQRVAWRIEGDYLHAHFESSSDQIHNLRGNFAHLSTGIVFRF